MSFWDDIGGDFFGGDESSVGITGIMGVDAPTWGDYSGPSVFDSYFPTGNDLYNPTLTEFYGGNYELPIGDGVGIMDLAAGAGGGLFGNMSLSDIARLAGQGLSIGSGLNALNQARQLRQQAAAADPLGPYRGEIATRLMGLLRDPGSIVNDPGWAAGEQAVQRTLAAQGYTGSGNAQDAIRDFGGKFYERAVARLAGLVGGTPGAGLSGTQSAINLTNAGVNRITSGIASLAQGLE